MNTDEHRWDEIDPITEQVIGCAFKVSNTLGTGFLEKVYENALVHEVRKAGLTAEQQKPIHVRYDGVIVGDYVVDLLIQNCVILELKAISSLSSVEYAQGLNYLRATGFPICLLMNFGVPRLQIKRIVL